VKLGRRSLKFVDYGIMAATFVNLESNKAYRILSTEESRELAPLYAPGVAGEHRQQTEGYLQMPDSALFRVQQVRVAINAFDLPGPTRSKVSCGRCGQVVRDHREVIVKGMPLCKPCANGAYFRDVREITWQNMNWAPTQGSMSSNDIHKTDVHKLRLYRFDFPEHEESRPEPLEKYEHLS
jgi:formylmethanofuran dehydrogenase subunit E